MLLATLTLAGDVDGERKTESRIGVKKEAGE